MLDAISIRKKRALMRAEHRGIKEMDILLGQYARAKLELMTEEALAHFEDFLELDDHSLYAAIARGEAIEEKYQAICEDIRQQNDISR